jgi:hypothetical protein
LKNKKCFSRENKLHWCGFQWVSEESSMKREKSLANVIALKLLNWADEMTFCICLFYYHSWHKLHNQINEGRKMAKMRRGKMKKHFILCASYKWYETDIKSHTLILLNTITTRVLQQPQHLLLDILMKMRKMMIITRKQKDVCKSVRIKTISSNIINFLISLSHSPGDLLSSSRYYRRSFEWMFSFIFIDSVCQCCCEFHSYFMM